MTSLAGGERPLRLGAVSYLNTRPLVRGLDRLPASRLKLEFDVPSRLAARLAAGELDLAMIPSIEYARGAGYAAVPGLCIASDGPARSVLLFSRVPPAEVRTLALDPASRTSVALVTILMRELWSAGPAFTEDGGPIESVLSRQDACLVIGDRALFAAVPPGVLVTDLGEAWKQLTGLPFVYAFWAGRRDTVEGADEIVQALQLAARDGLEHLDEIAAAHEWGGLRDPGRALSYLRDAMKYSWRQRERDGLLRFYLLAARHGLIEDVPEVSFFGEPAFDTVRQ
jgi:chorismate dehydratase